MNERRVSRARLEKRALARRRFLRALVVAGVLAALAPALPRIARESARRLRLPVRRVILNDPSFRHLFETLEAEEPGMFAVSPEEIAAAAARHPSIASARVRRLYPDTVLVSLTRRAPFARAYLAGGGKAVVDREGIPVDPKPGRAENAYHLLEIHDLPPEKMPETVREIEEISGTFRFFRPRAVVVAENHFVLRDGEGREVRIRPGEYRRQAVLLKRILDDFARKEVRYLYIDLRFDEPVFRPGRISPGALPRREN